MKFTLQEACPASAANQINFILEAKNFSVAGFYDLKKNRLAGEWSAYPRQFKTKQIKSQVEAWCVAHRRELI